MSIPLRIVRDRVRRRLRDLDNRRSTFDPLEYDEAICDAYILTSARLPAASLYTASAFTIGVGDTFTLPATVSQYTGGSGEAEYAGDVRIQLARTGQYLVKQSREQLEARRNGQPSVAGSIPFWFALWEENDQDVQGLVYPAAQQAEACNLFRTMMADDLRDFIGTGSDDADDVEVMFTRLAATALQLIVAADMLERMTPEDLKLRRLDPKVAPNWRKEAEIALYRDTVRRHNLEDAGRTQRWVT